MTRRESFLLGNLLAKTGYDFNRAHAQLRHIKGEGPYKHEFEAFEDGYYEYWQTMGQ